MPRTTAERIAAARDALTGGVDGWVATASPSGRPHLVPLSFAYLDDLVLVATLEKSATARNVAATQKLRLGLGELRDVVMVEATGSVVAWSAAEPRLTATFVSQRGWDPATEPRAFVLLTLRATRIQVWRDVDEITGRDVMRDGRWLDAG